MLIVNQCRDLLDELDVDLPMQAAYVCLVVESPDVSETLLNKVKSLGYMAFVRTTAMGEEVIITDKKP